MCASCSAASRAATRKVLSSQIGLLASTRKLYFPSTRTHLLSGWLMWACLGGAGCACLTLYDACSAVLLKQHKASGLQAVSCCCLSLHMSSLPSQFIWR